MRIGVVGPTATGRLDEIVEAARRAADDELHTFWIGQAFGLDTLTALGVAARDATGIELGTSVVPIQPRHPQVLAQQAITVQQASAGRLVLGIGLSHRSVVEERWGLPFERPVEHMREFLAVLLPLLRGEPAEFRGRVLTCVGAIETGGAPPPPVLLAALGPRMLALAGEEAAGTITGSTGPKTLAAHTVPAIRAAADRAGRPPPRVVAALPVCVTSDPAAARRRLGEQTARYRQFPSYRAMLDREGVEGPAEIAVVGDEEEALRGLARLADAGATDVAASEAPGDPEEAARTRTLLSRAAREGVR